MSNGKMGFLVMEHQNGWRTDAYSSGDGRLKIRDGRRDMRCRRAEKRKAWEKISGESGKHGKHSGVVPCWRLERHKRQRRVKSRKSGKRGKK